MGNVQEIISFATLCNFLKLCLLISNQLLAIWVCILVHIGTALYKKENSAFLVNTGTEKFIVSADYTLHHC